MSTDTTANGKIFDLSLKQKIGAAVVVGGLAYLIYKKVTEEPAPINVPVQK